MNLWARFDALLVEKAIPDNYHNHYRKWLRYYLDFCQKYNHPHHKRGSLPYFIKKLQDKKQTYEQQKQASFAVYLYYGLLQSGSNKESPLRQPIMSQRLAKVGEKVTLPLAPSHQGRGEREKWKAAYAGLTDEIKIRHYSSKTLKTYSMWLRKFQAFTDSKDTQT